MSARSVSSWSPTLGGPGVSRGGGSAGARRREEEEAAFLARRTRERLLQLRLAAIRGRVDEQIVDDSVSNAPSEAPVRGSKVFFFFFFFFSDKDARCRPMPPSDLAFPCDVCTRHGHQPTCVVIFRAIYLRGMQGNWRDRSGPAWERYQAVLNLRKSRGRPQPGLGRRMGALGSTGGGHLPSASISPPSRRRGGWRGRDESAAAPMFPSLAGATEETAAATTTIAAVADRVVDYYGSRLSRAQDLRSAPSLANAAKVRYEQRVERRRRRRNGSGSGSGNGSGHSNDDDDDDGGDSGVDGPVFESAAEAIAFMEQDVDEKFRAFMERQAEQTAYYLQRRAEAQFVAERGVDTGGDARGGSAVVAGATAVDAFLRDADGSGTMVVGTDGRVLRGEAAQIVILRKRRARRRLRKALIVVRAVAAFVDIWRGAIAMAKAVWRLD